MAVTTTKTNKPLNPRGNDQSPKGYNRAELYTGKVLDFDGTNDKVNITTSSFDLYAISFYFKGAIGTASNGFAFHSGGATNDGVSLGSLTGSLTNETITIGEDGDYTAITETYDDGIHFITFSWDATNSKYKAYVNAQEIETINNGSDASLITGITAPALGVRKPLSDMYLDGGLSNVRAFSTALTAAQVADLYNNPEKIVPTGVADSALKLWLPMMEGAGTTAYDGSGNGNHGTISGATWTHGIGAPVAQTAVVDWNKYSITDTTDYATASSTTIASEGTVVFKHVPLASVNPGYFTFYGAASTGQGRAIRQNGTKYSFVGFGSSPQDFNTSKDVEVGKITNVAYSWNASGDVKVYIDGVKVGDANKTLYTPTSSSFNINRRVDGIQYHNEIMFYAGLYDEVLSESQIQDIQDGTTNPESVSGLIHFWRNSNDWQDEVGSADLTENDNAGKVLFPQTLTTGRDLAGNIFANVRKQGALNLDGNSWAEVHDNASLDFGTGSFTLEAWVRAKYVNQGSGVNAPLSLGGDGASYSAMFVKSNNVFSFYYNGFFINSSAQTEGDWVHIVGTYDETNQTLYIDGSQVAQNARSAADISNALVKHIGRDSTTFRTYQDSIAQPRIYDRALTAEEVERNYNAGKNIYK